MLRWTRLPFDFDVAPLQAEVGSIVEEQWVPHFNTHDYDGQWSSVSLRSASGRAEEIVPQSSSGEYLDTPLMAAMPALAAVVRQFQMPLKAVRLLRLHAGSRVKEHRDYDLGMDAGELRFHVPIITSDAVEFIVADRQLPLRAGESWYVDFSQPHRIFNGGTEHRVHLVIDGQLNAWADELLQTAVREIATPTSVPRGIEAFQAFSEMLQQDKPLRAALMQHRSPPELVAAVAAAAVERGFALDEDDVNSVLRAHRADWISRVAIL
ncbi:aspartyl/asparaginyl beta-hydroxylase domain-containing protein [Granulicella cerasi]|uniref:Aspartyl/asparaginyl beta-hydroxylase domain-containing protein n=1 Tax=Granulicella cerasi TaxID=741063 RepID=A0ABW1ZA06_9BACT|nr:aspartyl/asparaginyl beta-hydroxylase domain-containing protein [Granulicella cerasi]